MWPRGPVSWIDNRVLHISIPFTWNLPEVKEKLVQRSLFWDMARVGGPAVRLLPEYFANMAEYVEAGAECYGVLHRINPLATRTTIGCVRRCQFCGVSRIEGTFEELQDWQNKPVLCDNNLLAASDSHLEKVFGRLIDLREADFNQGLDARLLKYEHAEMIAKIRKSVVRLSLDTVSNKDRWSTAFDTLRSVGIAKSKIRSYCLVAFDSDPGDAWDRCTWIEEHGVKVLPMWFHELDAMQPNSVTGRQRMLGWSDYERRKIMQWFYQHKRAVNA